MATYLFETPASQSQEPLALQWRRAEALGVTVDQALGSDAAPSRGWRRRKTPHDKLKAGDTLVVSEVGCLGETYAEISDAITALMRRRVSLRSVKDNLTFDGAVEDVGALASRDALIAYAAAAAETAKAARRAAEARQALLEEPPWSHRVDKDSNSAVLQIGVIAAQLGALALAAYLLGFVAPDLKRHAPAAPSAQIAGVEQTVEPPRYATKEFLFEVKPTTTEPKPKEQESAAPPQTDKAPGETASAAPPERAAQATGFSPQEESQIVSVVGDWRSARVRNPNFSIAIGETIPAGLHLATFPRRLVRQQPTLSRYKFITVDGRIVLVDPAARQIAAVLSR
ncbi:MAG: DUF1236 domain-containing protein [Methylocystis sp.]|uniref:DUF1236 domain-containing protein n=1 Tax=Methylocystis sp. TaxID=1911079 RepID=UPI003DA6CD97